MPEADVDAGVEQSTKGTIQRAARILRALAGAPQGLTLSAISALTDLPRSTTHRLIKALEEEELTAPAGEHSGFRLGAGFLRSAASINGWLASHVRPELLRLSSEVGETVDLAFLVGGKMIFVDQVVVPHRLQVVSLVGSGLPLHCTASGKALLKSLEDREVLALLGPSLARYTKNTLSDSTSLLREIRSARDGVAIDRDEHTEGVSGIAVALNGPFGIAAAVGMPIPTARFIGREANLTRALLLTRQRLVDILSS
jgi:DNA-binding IclR family transcriptional regulator